MTLVPFIKVSGETKTKPTQHSVQKLREIGIQPDILLCRTEGSLRKEEREKIGLFCNLPPEAVIEGRDVDSIYKVPLSLEREGLSEEVIKLLELQVPPVQLNPWRRLVEKIERPQKKVKIAVAGKYIELQDAYKSIIEAFIHAGVENNARVELEWVGSEGIEKEGAEAYLKQASGLLVPGGFGERGIEGKILAVKYARENDLPFFGICLGMQCAVIEFARSACGLTEANSREFSHNVRSPVIDFMPDQVHVRKKGGTMRLGAYPCILKKKTLAYKVYDQEEIRERHRHRYEVNNDFRSLLEKHGMVFSGLSPDGTLVEILELPDKRWFLAVQFHPEFKSRALRAHPLFRSFVKAALEYQKEHQREL